MVDYKSTINLPSTEFPMKANLPVKEPEFVEKWTREGLYEKIIDKNKSKKRFIMHDGPPYANGNIHFGHILNKVLKDIVVKYRNMNGFCSEYIPGWDCHGLPIELQVEKDLGKKEGISISEIRDRCGTYALKFVDIQKNEFKRLGVLADWDNPYLTLNHHYEATVVREFGKFVKKGLVYKGKKPVYWCSSCQTALAEAEVEYQDHTSNSIYVKFHLDDKALEQKLSPDGAPVYAVIWTTTPWTIPSNLAIALNATFDYVLVSVHGEKWIIAESLLNATMNEIGVSEFKIVGSVNVAELERAKFKHPLIDRESLLILGDHVTMDAGTGCVHTAPGHGREDFDIGQKYGLAPFAPIDFKGCFTKEVGLDYLVGQHVEKANSIVIEKLKEVNALAWSGKVTHQYPHCWRCKRPIIYLSTEQWFISMEKNNLRKRAMEVIEGVNWIPKWGRDRIFGMIEGRPDWCISRQRSWGVPIVALRCKPCDKSILSEEVIENVAKIFEKEGSGAWFSKPVEELVPKNFCCPNCKGHDLTKENDIIDVWFESGVSYAAVIEGKPHNHIPVDLYLEGSDQHRGWFHSALLSGVATRDMAPYISVLTHGFVVDADGKKYSKSAKNYVPADKVLNNSGAEILRLWVAAEDYRNDIRVSDEILKRLMESYRKIRNTCRFILGNISDFDPKKDAVEYKNMQELDKWMLHRLQLLIEKCRSSYENYEFHVIYHALNEFAIVDLSSFYLDIIKDRLYCEKKDGNLRRSAQTAMWMVLDSMARLMAPILSFMSEEIWGYMPAGKDKAGSVHLSDMPEVNKKYFNDEVAAKWDRFKTIRSEVTKILETARQDKTIGNSLQAKVTLEVSDDLKSFLSVFGELLPDLFIVSKVMFGTAEGKYVFTSEEVPGLKISVESAAGDKCERCWKYDEYVGKDANHPTICKRCVGAVS